MRPGMNLWRLVMPCHWSLAMVKTDLSYSRLRLHTTNLATWYEVYSVKVHISSLFRYMSKGSLLRHLLERYKTTAENQAGSVKWPIAKTSVSFYTKFSSQRCGNTCYFSSKSYLLKILQENLFQQQIWLKLCSMNKYPHSISETFFCAKYEEIIGSLTFLIVYCQWKTSLKISQFTQLIKVLFWVFAKYIFEKLNEAA